MGEVLRLRSSEADVVEDTWRRFVPSARLRSATSPDFRFAWDSISIPGLCVLDYELAADVRATLDPATQLVACRMSAGTVRVGPAREEIDASTPWLCPESSVAAEADWDGVARVKAFVFDLGFAEEFARTLTGDDRLLLRATDPHPVSEASARQWAASFDYVRGALSSKATQGDPFVEAELRRHALRMTLAAFPTTVWEAVGRTAQRGPAPGVVRRARAFMDAHAHEPITVDDVARAAHITTRGLQYAFKRESGESPMVYLRRVRLAGAHEELRRGTGVTVSEVARRWGFAHASRFAQYYRDEYGELPGRVARG